MGIAVHPRWPPTPGPDCPSCSPSPWPAGATPAVVRAVFRGLASYPGWPSPPNRVPIPISNDSINPCAYTSELLISGARFNITYDAPVSVLILTLTSPFSWEYFNGVLAPCSIGPFTNTCSFPDMSPIGGSGVLLDFPLSIIVTLTQDYNLQPDHYALYDVIDSLEPGLQTVRLTGRTSPGSCLIKVSP